MEKREKESQPSFFLSLLAREKRSVLRRRVGAGGVQGLEEGGRDCAKGAKRGGWSCRTGGSQPVSPCIWETAMHLCMFCGYRMLLANNAPFYVAHDSRLRCTGCLLFLSSTVVSFFKNTVAISSPSSSLMEVIPRGCSNEGRIRSSRKSKKVWPFVRNSFRHR